MRLRNLILRLKTSWVYELWATQWRLAKAEALLLWLRPKYAELLHRANLREPSIGLDRIDAYFAKEDPVSEHVTRFEQQIQTHVRTGAYWVWKTNLTFTVTARKAVKVNDVISVRMRAKGTNKNIGSYIVQAVDIPNRTLILLKVGKTMDAWGEDALVAATKGIF